MKTKNFDIVHGFRPTPFSGYLGYKIARKKKIPFVLEMGDEEWQTMKALGTHPRYRVEVVKYLEKKLITKADGITSMSPSLAARLHQQYGKEVKAIPSGIDVAVFSPDNKDPALREEFEEKVRCKRIIIFVGKLDKSGHIMDVVRVLPRVKNVGLVVVGEGEGRKELEYTAEELKVKQRCYFAGSVPHEKIPQYLNAADILVAPFSASMEGAEVVLNLKILEYMGMQKPIIVSGIGVLKDFLKDCAFVFEPGNVDDFAAKIRQSVLNKEEAEKRARNARQKIIPYDWSNQAEKMVEYYKEVIERFKSKKV